MHVLSGLYMCVRRRPAEVRHRANAHPRWEFSMTFDYEWALYRRRMPFKWTMLVRPTHHVCTVLRAPLIFCGLLVHTCSCTSARDGSRSSSSSASLSCSIGPPRWIAT